MRFEVELARRGADVAFNYLRSHEAAAETKRQIEALGVRCLQVRAHLGDTAKVRELFAEVGRSFGSLDILVNNAASGVQRPASELEEKHWDWAMNINARAPWLCAIEASRLMTSGGSIVNIASIAALRGVPDEKEPSIAYSASKGALISLTRDLAVKLAPDHIRVNCISPGAFDTDMFAWVRDDPAKLADFERQVPMARPGCEDDIKGVVVFLASAASSYVTGANLVVDGGWLVGA